MPTVKAGVQSPLFLFKAHSMKLELNDILERVSTTESARADYVTLAAKWEKMWLLDPGFTQNLQDSISKEGREQVVSPDPFNVVNLAQRLIATLPRIDIPPNENTHDGTKSAQRKEQFFTAMWQRVAHMQGRNVLQDAAWNSLVRGRSAFEVKWIKEDLPPTMRKNRFPILIRTLDPLNVGVHRGPLYTEYAFHKYRDSVVNVRQRYPKLTVWKEDDKIVRGETKEVCVIDFWWMDHETGDIWNAVLVEGEFAKKPTKTAYTFIPIIEVYGDSAPTKGESHRGMSILHSMNGLWQYKCRLLSNIGTGALWATWPFFTISHPMGEEIKDITVRPGATETVPEGTKIDQIMPQVNLSIIQSMLDKVDEGLQQSAFPKVLYGEAGSMQAGYGVSLLSDAAKGRIKSPLEYLEMGVMLVNEAVMALVEAFDDDDEGVELWGKEEGSGKLYKLCLYKKDIGGYYENLVTLRPSLPQDDLGRMAFGLQMVQGGMLSRQTFWDKWVNVAMPTDEDDRIWAQKALENPDLQQNMMLVKLMEQYPKTWENIIKGTPLEEVASRIAGPKPQPQLEMMPDGMMPPAPGGPMPPDPMGMMGPPPDLMMPPGMPGLPPMPLQPPAIPMPMGGGIPPAMQGQLEPENLGLPPAGDPALFAQLMGNPLPDSEQLNLLAGLPQEGRRR
jgi:hypothetical protein